LLFIIPALLSFFCALVFGLFGTPPRTTWQIRTRPSFVLTARNLPAGRVAA
jgi:hypothetical protein